LSPSRLEVADEIFRQGEVISERGAAKIAVSDWSIRSQRAEAGDRSSVPGDNDFLSRLGASDQGSEAGFGLRN
jgi:hypothetical protein